jgi:hypothetical protein
MPKAPHDPNVREMIDWIATNHDMSRPDLARMFQTSPAAIEAWLENGNIDDAQYMKLRRSYFFLNSMPDPHFNQRKCAGCGLWKDSPDYSNGQALCRSCQASGSKAIRKKAAARPRTAGRSLSSRKA